GQAHGGDRRRDHPRTCRYADHATPRTPLKNDALRPPSATIRNQLGGLNPWPSPPVTKNARWRITATLPVPGSGKAQLNRALERSGGAKIAWICSENERRPLREGGQRRRRRIEQRAAAELAAIAPVNHRLAGRAGAENADQAAVVLQLFEQPSWLALHGAVDEDDVIGRERRPAGVERPAHDGDVGDRKLGKRLGAAPRTLGIVFERDHGGAEVGEHGGRIAGPAGHIEHSPAAANLGRLYELGEHHRLEQTTACIDRNV